MREIKFRAWCKRHKVMIYHIGSINWNEQNNIFVNQDAKCAGNEILMQYTGLKDKNGKEIYEGDILLYDSGSKTSVFYNNGAFVRSYGNSNMYLLYDSFIEDGCLYNYEVIGNIYENPELLEGEE